MSDRDGYNLKVPIVWTLLAGALAGLAGGLFGVGGGLIIVPFLVIALGFDQHKAQGTSLLALTLPVAGVGAYQYAIKGSSDIATGVLIASGILAGSYLGSKIAVGTAAKTLRQAFCVFVAAVAVYLFFKSSILASGDTEAALAEGAWTAPVKLLIGLVAGLTGGLFGVGGGIIAVPCMVLILKFPQHLAQGTSLFALALPVAALGAYNYYRKGCVDFKTGLIVASSVVVGSLVGSQVALSLDPITMQRAFAGFAIVMSGYLFFKR